jgi:hypothetical protein
MITKKTLLPLAALMLLPLTGCTGGAQVVDPAGDAPGSEKTATSPAQANQVDCTRVLDSALAALGDEVDDDVLLAYAREDDGTWYVAAPVGENNVLSDTVGLWTTTGDVESDEFDGTFESVNDDAQSSSTWPVASEPASAEQSDAGQQALSCIEDAGETAR